MKVNQQSVEFQPAEMRTRLIPTAEALFNAIKGFFRGAGATSLTTDDANNQLTL